jgi:2-dehydro-3-deoxyphosphogluconate aldolase/(4S)-4-hydroxy-2-oxoglutarate aldolase
MQTQTENEQQILETISNSGVVAIIRLEDLSQALTLTRTLLDSGITALEFTLTNPQALEVITTVKAACPEFDKKQAVIGAGTVLNASATRASVEAGAQFIVAPSTNFETIATCRQLGVPAMPGALTPTEIVNAWEAGASVIKVFPSRAFGPAYFKDLREPLPHLKLMATGGVNLQNVGEFIKNGVYAVGVGGNLVDRQLIAAQNWAELGTRATAYVEAIKAARS